jgi:DNA polymerase
MDERNKVKLLKQLERKSKTCKLCSLWKHRRKAVFGEGPENARIMLIGLGPGKQEDMKGRPFVGPAGKLLDALLTLAGIKREEVYITNIVKCFPPNNSPKPEQVRTCTKNYLEKQLKLIKPEIIVTLGNLSTGWIFSKFHLKPRPMSEIHGKIFEIKGNFVKYVIPMYHPAAALRNPPLRKILLEDWKKLKEFFEKEI